MGSIKHALQSRLLWKPPVEGDPRLLSPRTKGIIIFCLAICASTSGFSSTIYFPGLPLITEELKAPSIATTLTAALFVLFMGLAPVVWASISDHYQIRRLLFLVSMIIFSVASLGATFVQNIWPLVVLRCIQSIGSSCGNSVGAGVIADCYPIEKRGAAFGKYFFGTFFGPLLGPIIGGFLILSDKTWRATFWFCFAYSLFIALTLFFILPETYRVNSLYDNPKEAVDVPSSSKEDTEHRESFEHQPTIAAGELEKGDKDRSLNYDNNTDPAHQSPKPRQKMNIIAPFLLLRHPFVFMISFVGGIAFGCMFSIETVIPDLYEKNYGFNSWQTGLSYLGGGVGNMMGSIVGGMLSDRLLMRARSKRGGQPLVEDRLTANLWPAGLIIVPFGLLLFGWTITYKTSVWASIVAFGIHTFGMNQISTSTAAYLVDAMPGQGASVTAAANLMRMIIACALTLVANPMVTALGAGWMSVLLAGLTWLSMAILFVVKLRGERLRKYSGF
ncbi:major facilitator superfamily domain-containing protein [Phycomyces blakesleeanus]|uniref:Major facilitator superfamily domain-containing protein n=1 Tax=Phycomyces blakesleeanus TaxID=4837 RepID=A0ABR3AUP7_PHYBL